MATGTHPQPQQQQQPQTHHHHHQYPTPQSRTDLITNPVRLPNQIEIRYQWPSLLCPDVANPSIRWIIGSRFVIPAVGMFSKFWMNVVNKSTVHNANILYETLNRNYQTSMHPGRTHQKRRPLITYCNHTSCMDDPLIWGSLLPFTWLLNSNRLRWTSAAADVCFSSKIYETFFSLGKTFPVVRGEGIYQPAMNYASRLMSQGMWLHFFPQGRVVPRPEHADPALLRPERDPNQEVNIHKPNEPYSLKWGIARLIIEHVLSEGENKDKDYTKIVPDKFSMADLPECQSECCKTLPEVDILPMYHIGMDEVLPTKRPYIPRIFCCVTFLVRPEGPIRIDRNFLMKLFTDNDENNNNKTTSSIELSLQEKRIRLMKFLENELNILAEKTKNLHFKLQGP